MTFSPQTDLSEAQTVALTLDKNLSKPKAVFLLLRLYEEFSLQEQRGKRLFLLTLSCYGRDNQTFVYQIKKTRLKDKHIRLMFVKARPLTSDTDSATE